MLQRSADGHMVLVLLLQLQNRKPAVRKRFWARSKSELGEHLRPKPKIAYSNAGKIFSSKLLSSFSMSAIYCFLKYLLPNRQMQASSDSVVQSVWNNILYYKYNQYFSPIGEIEVSPWIASTRPIFWPFATSFGSQPKRWKHCPRQLTPAMKRQNWHG